MVLCTISFSNSSIWFSANTEYALLSHGGMTARSNPIGSHCKQHERVRVRKKIHAEVGSLEVSFFLAFWKRERQSESVFYRMHIFERFVWYSMQTV